MTDLKLLLLDSTTWNHLAVKKKKPEQRRKCVQSRLKMLSRILFTYDIEFLWTVFGIK